MAGDKLCFTSLPSAVTLVSSEYTRTQERHRDTPPTTHTHIHQILPLAYIPSVALTPLYFYLHKCLPYQTLSSLRLGNTSMYLISSLYSWC